MRSNVHAVLLAGALLLPGVGCLPVPIGVGVTVPVGEPPPPPVIEAAPAPGPGFEVNVDRPGADYRSFNLGAPQPKVCWNACMSDPACAAFTYVNPGLQGPTARCWLKNSVPPPNPNGCCISGVKYASAPPPPPPPPPPRGRPLERGFDRPGLDYRSFDLPAPDPEMCRQACYGEAQCVAFTFVHPGVQGPNARCWLKSAVPRAVPNGCCVSGVK